MNIGINSTMPPFKVQKCTQCHDPLIPLAITTEKLRYHVKFQLLVLFCTLKKPDTMYYCQQTKNGKLLTRISNQILKSKTTYQLRSVTQYSAVRQTSTSCFLF